MGTGIDLCAKQASEFPHGVSGEGKVGFGLGFGLDVNDRGSSGDENEATEGQGGPGGGGSLVASAGVGEIRTAIEEGG